MRILAIETSADETGVALIEASGSGEKDFQYKILGNALLSQAELHTRYGGIFPNLAKREHGRNLVPVLMEALRLADDLNEGVHDVSEEVIEGLAPLLTREHEMYTYLAGYFRAYGMPHVDAIAVTMGPGLEPALWVGINFAKALQQAWAPKKEIPIVGVNHLEGHILVALAHDVVESSQLKVNTENQSPLFDPSTNHQLSTSNYPAIGLLVSGGHTELVLMEGWRTYKTIGATRDDAAGEAFDKTARLMTLPYPGGPQISALAEKARAGNFPKTFELPRPMIKDSTYDFSFSGLKTAVKKIADGLKHPSEETLAALARETEEAIVDVLVAKTKRAVEEYGAETVIVGGGVSANAHLRVRFHETFGDSVELLFPPTEFATDNAVMIALAGYFKAQKKEFIDAGELRAEGNLRLS